MGQLKAGVARTAITPPVGTFLMGYAARDHGATGVHDDLAATALVLSDGETRLAWLSCDLIFVHPDTVSRVREQVARQAGIPAARLMACCSHTHSGPVMWAAAPDEEERARRQRYLDELVECLVDLIIQADRGLQDAAWGMGRGTVQIGANRRQRLPDGRVILGTNEDGAIDPELLVLRVDALPVGGTENGSRPLAAWVNYACHAVCLSSHSSVVSADWPGVMRRAVEQETGARVGFVQGAGADINPLGGPQDTFEGAERLGTIVAQEAVCTYRQIALTREVSLAAERRVLDLPLQAERPEMSDPGLLAQILGVPADQISSFLDLRFPWAAAVSGHGEGQHVPVEIQAFRLGNTAVVAVAAEPFVEIGLAVKARSTAAFTMFAGYANGSIGYLPTRHAYDWGGYEVDTAYIYYRLPAPLASTCADRVVDGALDVLRAL
jgi:neutral ceramidase